MTRVETETIEELEGAEATDRLAPSIEEVLEETRHSPNDRAFSVRTPSSTVVGEVLEAANRSRALVRWDDGRDVMSERWLPVVRGTDVRAGDRVILERPVNWPDWIVTCAFEQTEKPLDEEVHPLSTERVEVEVDGRRVEIEGTDEIVLRCGKASITLRRNGRLVIRGTYVESYSQGTNRIKGGSVQIN